MKNDYLADYLQNLPCGLEPDADTSRFVVWLSSAAAAAVSTTSSTRRQRLIVDEDDVDDAEGMTDDLNLGRLIAALADCILEEES